jgi:CO/xanthine dehydrogenase Mo-binding subunit
MTTTAQRDHDRPGPYRVLGTRPLRHDGVDKVTGAARYGADIQLPGMLHGMMLRSPHAHARIRSINTSKAAALPGVRAVATAADFPIMAQGGIDLAQLQGNARMIAENVLAQATVLYKGHAVAAVAATDRHIAEEALTLIEVDYELLPTVLTLHDAMQPEAPRLHEEMTTRFRVERFARGDDTGVQSNIAGHIQHKLGDVEAGFRQADVIVEREFTTQSVHHGYIEPHVTTASWSPDDHVTIWTSTQGAFAIRSSTAAILGLAESQVKVIPMEIGGGFGGKAVTYLDPVAAVLARKSGRPVKIVMNRQEVFVGTGPSSATHMRAKIGATKDGKITAGQLYLAYEAGAFPGSPVGGGALTGFGPYKIEHLLVDGYDVVCNKQKVQGYRAPGQSQATLAVETVIDELAEQLGMDPMAFRLHNAVQAGDPMPNGAPHAPFGCRELEEAMLAHPHYDAPLPGPNQGRGMAVGFRWQGGQSSSATIHVNHNGTLNLITGSVDIGGTRTAVGHASRRGPGLAAGRDRPHRGRYGYHRVYGDDRRQPHCLRYGSGRHCRRRGGHAADGGACRWAVGETGRRGRLPRWRVYRQGVSYGAPQFPGPGGETHAHRRGDHLLGLGQFHRGGPHLCREYCGRGGGPGDGEGADFALHDLSRRGARGPPQLCGRADAGRHGPGHWLGAE